MKLIIYISYSYIIYNKIHNNTLFMFHMTLIFLLIIILLTLISSLLWIYNRYIKKNININIKLYNIFSDRSFTTYEINGNDTNFQINFKNSIYKFYNRYNYRIFPWCIYNYSHLNLKEYKINNDNFVNVLGFYNDITYCKEYKNLTMNTNDINDIDTNKIFKENDNTIHKLTIEDIDRSTIDLIEPNYNLYNIFINKFNDCDISILKVAAYGPSGTGKTHFLKNIYKIINRNKMISNSYGMYRNINEYILRYLTRFRNKSKNIALNIKNFIFTTYGYKYLIFYLNLNDNNNSDKINMFMEIFNKVKLLNYKLILICESDQYNNYYDDFDVIYKGDYLNSNQINDINNKLSKLNQLNNNQLNNNQLNKKENITINDIIVNYLTHNYHLID